MVERDGSFSDDLNRYWDNLVLHGRAELGGSGQQLATAVNELHTLAARVQPDSAFMDQLWQELMGTNRKRLTDGYLLDDEANLHVPSPPAAVPDRHAVHESADPGSVERARLDRLRRWGRELARIAAAAVVLIALAGLLTLVLRDRESTNEPPVVGASVTATSESLPVGGESNVSQLAYVSSGFRSPSDGHSQIYIVNADGSNARNLTRHPGNHLTPTWSPDGRQVAFVSDRDGYHELYVMDADGSNVRRITENDWREESPLWSPDGQQIAFGCYLAREYGGQADSRICVVDVDGSNPRVLTEGDAHGYGPVWSPDGSRVAFVGLGMDIFEQIYVMDADGSNLTQLTNNSKGSSSDPSWSPDGQLLAYAGAAGDGPSIYLMKADGTQQRRLTESPGRSDYAPVWSPDGSQIAFMSAAAIDDSRIELINADGSGRHEVSAGEGYNWHPTWSPDGQWITFVSMQDEGSGLMVVEADGSNLHTLIKNVAPDSAPAWRPVIPPDDDVTATPTTTPTQPVESQPPPSLEEIYAQMEASLNRPGMIYHSTIEVESSEDSFDQGGSIEQWIDVNRNVAREERAQEYSFEGSIVRFEIISIVTATARHTLYLSPESRLDTNQSRTCYGMTEAASVVLGCPGALDESTTTVEMGDYQGQQVVILVTLGTSRGSDETFTYATRRYLDPETFLPLAEETEGAHTYGPVRTRSVYRHEFVPIDSVSPGFFDPVSLAAQRLDAATVDTPVYWLGTHFEPADGLPSLVLQDGGVPGGEVTGHRVTLSYRQPEVRFQPNGPLITDIVMHEWSRPAWEVERAEQVDTYWASQPCHEQREIELEQGRATIYMGYEDTSAPSVPTYDAAPGTQAPNAPACSHEPYSRFEAVVRFDDTVVLVFTSDPSLDNPYNSSEGIEAIVRALQPMATSQ